MAGPGWIIAKDCNGLPCSMNRPDFRPAGTPPGIPAVSGGDTRRDTASNDPCNRSGSRGLVGTRQRTSRGAVVQGLPSAVKNANSVFLAHFLIISLGQMVVV